MLSVRSMQRSSHARNHIKVFRTIALISTAALVGACASSPSALDLSLSIYDRLRQQPLPTVPSYRLTSDEAEIINVAFGDNDFRPLVDNELRYFGENEGEYLFGVTSKKADIGPIADPAWQQAIHDAFGRSREVIIVETPVDGTTESIVWFDSIRDQAEELLGTRDPWVGALYPIIDDLGDHCLLSPVGFSESKLHAVLFVGCSGGPGGYSYLVTLEKIDGSWQEVDGPSFFGAAP